VIDDSAERNPVEVLAEEFLARQRLGERPSLTEYVLRYPQLADEIRELFPVLLDMEDARRDGDQGLDSATVVGGPVPARVGDYRVLREIGRGGMAVVYEAEQESLGRRVALKVLAGTALTPQQVRRFEREARSAARLHHTNIVPVFGVGHEGNVHYYVMQYIPGQPLDQVLKEVRRLRRGNHRSGQELAGASVVGAQARPSAGQIALSLWSGGDMLPVIDHGPEGRSTTEYPAADPTRPDRPERSEATPDPPVDLAAPAIPSSSSSDVLSSSADLTGSGRRYAIAVARIGAQVADALEYAAEQGIIHRDVKPSNILLDLGGTAWVTDFGLAKVSGLEDLTHSGDLVGTLRYMAPERFRGEADRRSDVYALGLTLYELLALRPAHNESDRVRLVRQVTEEEPPRLSKLGPTIPRDLATIVHKAMAREPAERYATAGALAADLKRFLEDRPIVARRPSLLDRAAKWSRRHRAAVVAGAMGLALALAILFGGLGWIVRDRAFRSEATERRVSLALLEAAEFQDRAKWLEALEATKRAEGFLAVGGSESLHRRVRERQRDLKMVLRLDEIRLPRTVNGAEAGFDNLRADTSYAKAFREYGIDVEALEPSEAARRIRSRPIGLELTAALDHWAFARWYTHQADETSPKRLLAVARAADADEWRNRLRDAWEQWDHETLTKLLASPRISDLSVQTLDLLCVRLDKEHELSVWRRAQREHPGDYWMNFRLAYALDDAAPPFQDLDEAVRFYTAAVSIRPRYAQAHFYLGDALWRRGKRDEAIALYRKAIALDPDFVTVHLRLVSALDDQGKREEAIAVFRTASELRPDNPEELNSLAWFLATDRRLEFRNPSAAVEVARRAVGLAPMAGTCWNTLGVALYRAGDWNGAIAVLVEKSMALRHGGDSFDWFFLAMAHWQRGERDEPRRLFDQSVQWMEKNNPKDPELRRFREEAAKLLQTVDRASSESKKGPR
jgi:serine/threonine protein kinase/tetratricopeptide (TPR) repeat protein